MTISRNANQFDVTYSRFGESVNLRPWGLTLIKESSMTCRRKYYPLIASCMGNLIRNAAFQRGLPAIRYLEDQLILCTVDKSGSLLQPVEPQPASIGLHFIARTLQRKKAAYLIFAYL